MADNVKLISRGKIDIKRLLPAKVETVWRFLTEDSLRSIWLCNGRIDPFIGGKIEFKFDTAQLGTDLPKEIRQSFKTEFEGTVTSYEPPYLLAFTWPGATPGQTTHVTIKLTADKEQTLLHLIHEHLHEDEYLIGASAGWHAHLEQLECHLSRKLSPNFMKRHKELDQTYRKIFNTEKH